MSNNTPAAARSQSALTILPSVIFGLIAFTAGLINTFWGNDTVFGIFLMGLSLIYFPFFDRLFTRITGIVLPWFIKVLLAVFIIWVTLGVGEIFAKIEMMIKDLR